MNTSVAELVKMGPNLKAPPTKGTHSPMHTFFSCAQASGDGYARKQLGLIFIVAVFVLLTLGITAN